MGDEDLLQICNDLVEKGNRLGADEVEVFAGTQRTIEAIIEGNDIKIAIGGENSGVGIRVFRNRSLGFASANTLSSENLLATMKSAIALSKNAPSDIHNGLPSPSKYGFVPSLYDESIVELEESEIIEKASRMLNAAKGIDDRVSVDNGRFDAGVGRKAIANSCGIEAEERFTAIYYDIGAHAIENGKVSSIDYRFDGMRNLRGERSEELSVELAEVAVESLAAEKVESFVGTVIISPLAAIELLVSPVLFSVDSNNVQKGLSRFATKRGEHVSAPGINILDNGLTPGGLSSSAFDREGVPHRLIEIIDGGRLRNYLYNSYTANKEGIESTGHATGGIRHVPSIDSTNIEVKGGNRALDDMISSVQRGILVGRFSGNIDPVSGDFSGLAKASKKIQGGAFGGAVRETMISGNVYDVLDGLSEVSCETSKVMDFTLPYFLVDEISITGI